MKTSIQLAIANTKKIALKAVSVLVASSVVLTTGASAGTVVTDGPSCYNAVSEACHARLPDGTYGRIKSQNAQYTACINNGLDKCDKAYPAKASNPGRPYLNRPGVFIGAAVKKSAS